MSQPIRKVDINSIPSAVVIRVVELLNDPNNKRMSAIEYLAWAMPLYSKTEVRTVIDYITDYLTARKG